MEQAKKEAIMNCLYKCLILSIAFFGNTNEYFYFSNFYGIHSPMLNMSFLTNEKHETNEIYVLCLLSRYLQKFK